MRNTGRFGGEMTGDQFAGLAQRKRTGEVFLDGDRVAVRVICQVNNTEPAGRNLLYNAISGNFQSFRQGGVVLCSHNSLLNTAIVWINHCFVKKR